jgi:prevent-host-death family protein
VKTASVTELKARLAHYLRMVRRGTEVQVLERGVPIARLVGIEPASGRDAERIERLAKAGIVRRGSGALRWLLTEPPIAPKRTGKLSAALDEDREDRF